MSLAARPLPFTPADWATIEQLYFMHDPMAIRSFLAEYPFILPLIHEAPRHIASYFPGAALSLELILDPEEGWDQVVAYIRTDLGEDEELQRLYQLADEWWLKVIQQAQMRFDIDVE